MAKGRSQCLQCGARLAFYLRIAGANFCSAEHHADYVREQQTLGLERLNETEKLLAQALAPPGAAAGRVCAADPEPEAPPLAGGLIPPRPSAVSPPVAARLDRDPEPALASTALPQRQVPLRFGPVPLASPMTGHLAPASKGALGDHPRSLIRPPVAPPAPPVNRARISERRAAELRTLLGSHQLTSPDSIPPECPFLPDSGTGVSKRHDSSDKQVVFSTEIHALEVPPLTVFPEHTAEAGLFVVPSLGGLLSLHSAVREGQGLARTALRSDGPLEWAATAPILELAAGVPGVLGSPAPSPTPDTRDLLDLPINLEAHPSRERPRSVSAGIPLFCLPAVQPPEHTPGTLQYLAAVRSAFPAFRRKPASPIGRLVERVFPPPGWMARRGVFAIVAPLLIILIAAGVSLVRRPVGAVVGTARATARTTAPIERSPDRPLQDRWATVEQSIATRAGVMMTEDFRSGFDNWNSPGNLSRSWKLDETGFVLPRELAVYRPSQLMRDYTMEFLGEADRSALSWAFRIQDFKNYQVAKLAIVGSGPVPELVLRRYAVINGKETAHKETVLPFPVRGGAVLHVKMEVKGSDFAVYVGGRLAGFWSDPRIPSGGVGFFSGKGEISRIRWVTVTHQYDVLGRICAFLSPSAVASSSNRPHGSWK